jgi:hypothetical protein
MVKVIFPFVEIFLTRHELVTFAVFVQIIRETARLNDVNHLPVDDIDHIDCNRVQQYGGKKALEELRRKGWNLTTKELWQYEFYATRQ